MTSVLRPFALFLLFSPAAVLAQSPQPSPTPPVYAESIQVTASRIPEGIDTVPVSIQVVTAQELRDRGATDLKSALALAAGVDIAPGGDSGPAGSVPEFWGLREFDAFLLVVDGVPWGGAFNPALPTLDLADLDHIEVQRGPAPVMYGATSFVGVIQVVRRAPGQKGTRVQASGGGHTSGSVGLATWLPSWAGFDSSLTLDFERMGFEDERSSFKKAHLLWRNRRSAGRGVFSFDLDATLLRQQPASPTPLEDHSLSEQVPIDSNQNPLGAHLDEDRYFARLGYDRSLAGADWSTTLSYTHSGQDQFRGFLTAVTSVQPNAAGFRADIETNDLYFDTHLAWSKSPRWRLVAGADYLFGKAEAKGDTFEYGVELDGSAAPAEIPLGEARGIDDTRNFLGLYGNLEWLPLAALRFDLGLRLNHTAEERGEGDEEGQPEGGDEAEGERDDTRLSGGVGVTWTAWKAGDDRLVAFAGWKNTFKPAAIDFNLAESDEGEGGGILKPETSNSYEAGLKTELLHHALRLELAGFLSDLHNIVVSQSVNGLPALANAGQIRLKGLELSVVDRLGSSLYLRGSVALHDARFRDYLTEFDGIPTQLSGNRLEMSPQHLAALGLSWSPARGFFASGELSYVGSRYLDKRNTVLASSYGTLAALVGYRRGRFELRLSGRNLTDRRDPVSESELGDSQYYRLFPRHVDLLGSVSF
jgi:outer membrane receptor protein involved in Fe transport